MTPDQLREWTEPESADLAEWVAYSRDMRCALAAALEVNANHRETLRSIAKMDPATEGERMRQWASDALSGYTQPASVTMAQLMEEIARVKAELADALLAAKVEAADADRYQRRAEQLEAVLRELHETTLSQMPPAEAGKDAQDAWADRRAKARNDAVAILASGGPR